MKKEFHINFWYLIAAVLGILMLRDVWVAQQHVETIPYSEFQQLLAEGKIAEVAVGEAAIEGVFKEPRDGKTHFLTVPVPPELAETLAKYDVKFYAVRESDLLKSVLGWMLPTLGFVLIWMFLIRRMAGGGAGGGLMSIGKSKAKVYVEKDTKVTFADVAGVDEAKDELQEIVDFLKDPKEYGRLGARHAEGRAAGRPARHRQDAAGARRRRRGGRAVLLDQRLGVRRDVRRRRRRARARPVRAGAQAGALHHLHRRARRARPRARHASRWAATTRRSRR